MTLDDVFGAEGALAEHLPGFTYRAAQQRMASWSSRRWNRAVRGHRGDRIGKTFGYLLPVLLLERRAIISTGTHTLQDQLFGRDLPLLGAVVGRPMAWPCSRGAATTCVGTGSARPCATARATRGRYSSSRADSWGQTGDTGDLTELEDIAEDPALA